MSSPVYLIILKVIKKPEHSFNSIDEERKYNILKIKRISHNKESCDKDGNDPFVIEIFLQESSNLSLEKAGRLLSRIGELITEIGKCNLKAFAEFKNLIRDKLLYVVEIECSKDYTICKLMPHKEIPLEALLSESDSTGKNDM